MQSLKYLSQIANYLKVQPGKITLSEDLQPTRVHNNVSITGFVNVVLSFLNQSPNNINSLSTEDQAELYQWLEYAIVYAVQHEVSHNVQQILNELNGVLATKTYLVANKLTVADVALYYILQNVVENLQHIDKEKFINLCRWFDNLQQNSDVRQNNRMVNFSTSYLSGFVPARH